VKKNHRIVLPSSVIVNVYSVQFFIIYVPSQQLQGQLQTQHSVDTGNYIKDKRNIKTTATHSNNTQNYEIF
jgi:hypothetical protein